MPQAGEQPRIAAGPDAGLLSMGEVGEDRRAVRGDKAAAASFEPRLESGQITAVAGQGIACKPKFGPSPLEELGNQRRGWR